MAGIEDRLRALQGAGTAAGGGGFSIDGAQARDKLRAYQLAAPHEYVLLVVRAAALAGASRVDFEIDSDDVRGSFDAAFPAARIEAIFAELSQEAGDRAVRAELRRARRVEAAGLGRFDLGRLEIGEVAGPAWRWRRRGR